MPPGGSWWVHKVYVYTSSDNQEAAQAEGAIIINNDVFDKIWKGGEVPFEKFICTTEVLSNIKDLAWVLGPKGLFPNAKSGNLISP